MRSGIWAGLLCLAVAACGGGTSSGPSPPPKQVSGTVVAAEDGAPLAGVSVLAAGAAASSAADGRWRVLVPSDAGQRVALLLPGRANAELHVPSGTEPFDAGELRLQPALEWLAIGATTDEYVRLAARPNGFMRFTPSALRIIETGALPTWPVRATLAPLDVGIDPTVLSTGHRVRVAPGEPPMLLDIAGVTVGDVTDASGRSLGVPGRIGALEVRIDGATRSSPYSLQVFRFDADAGGWVNQASRAGIDDAYGVEYGGIEIRGDRRFGTWALGVPVAASAATGCVVDAAGAPAPGVRVWAVARSRRVAERATTDARGRFEVSVVRDAGTRFIALADDGRSAVRSAQPSGPALELGRCLVLSDEPGLALIEPPIKGVLVGSYVDPWGESIDEWRIHVVARGAPGEALRYQWLQNGKAIERATQPVLRLDGKRHAPGDTYQVVVTSADGRRSIATEPVPLDREPMNDLAEGRVTRTGDGLPLGGVRVAVVGTGRGTLTDSDGRYRLVFSEPAYNDVLSFSAAGYETVLRELPTSSPYRVTVDISLAPLP